MDDFDREDGASRNRFQKRTRLAVLFALVLVLGFAAGLTVGATGPSKVLSNVPLVGDGLDPTPDQNFDLTDFWKVYNVLRTRWVETHASSTPPTPQGEEYGAIEGLTASYGDPYTVFFPPQDAQVFEDDINGNFGGIGLEIGVAKDGTLDAIAPLKGSPADQAGIRPGDLILGIDGTSTQGMAPDAAVKAIRGPIGTTVTLTLYRSGKTFDAKITRQNIQVPTIQNSYDANTGIYTIALYTFTANSGDLFNQALADMRTHGATKLIIDLRGDPGGYLDAAVSIGSHFLPSGQTIVTEDYKGHQQNIVHTSTGSGGIPAGLKTVVLIDQGSASASEILSGALQDHHVATLIGTRSFGKGSVQELIPLGKADLKVTVARWLTPSGRSISDGGLTPDIKVDRTQDDVTAGKDPQMDRAIQFLTTGQ